MYYVPRTVLFLLLAGMLAVPANAQPHQHGNEPLHNLPVFEPLTLPTANQYRVASGKPGPEYWQQRADYTIKATLDPEAHTVTGTETITYTNNAPQPLDRLWLQLDQNLFRPGSRGASIQPADSRWRGSFPGGGYDITRVELIRKGERITPEFLIEDTAMRIPLSQPLATGEALDIIVDYSFKVPEYGADRMGRLDVEQGTVYEIAQWYPRMYVYDDVNGWNVLPYLGQGEFYLNYGTYNVELTVPRDFIVVATGELLNPDEVLTAEQRRRLDQARQSAETVMIVSPSEVGKAGTRPSGDGPLTWRYRAENVRDFSWAASQAFIWDAASYDETLIMSAYPKEGLSNGTGSELGWEKSTEFSRHSIKFYSETYYPYPYPVAINVAGVVGGMEYPMIVFCSVRARGEALFGVTDHELGHSWFPMIVGSDERRYAWMDEGFNTFINHYSNLAYYGKGATRADRQSSDYIAGQMMAPTADQPSMTYPDKIRRSGLGFLAYRKPAKGLILLREYVLGPKRFDPAFKEYIQRWAYMNPQPADFFRTMENVAGEDLDWFWRGWFYGTDVIDQAVTNVAVKDGRATVTLSNLAGLVMPLDFEVVYRDGTTEHRRIPVNAWTTSDTFEADLPRMDISSVTVDPDLMLPDVDRSNNTWSASDSIVPPQPRG